MQCSTSRKIAVSIPHDVIDIILPGRTMGLGVDSASDRTLRCVIPVVCVTNEMEVKCSQTTQLIRKDVYSNMKLHVSAYNGHRQISIPIKGSLYI